MIAQYVQDGRYIDYTPNADVAAGTVVVLGDLIGVSLVLQIIQMAMKA